MPPSNLSSTRPLPRFSAVIERWRPDGSAGASPAPAGVVLICEHASNALPVDWPELGGDLGISDETRQAHAAWDIGALAVSRGLAPHLARACGGAVVAHAPLSRLAYDLNRAPDHPGSMPEMSEIHPVPGNRDLTPEQRIARTMAIHQPFHASLSDEIMSILARGHRPVIIAVHSFTPIYHGRHRDVEFGILIDNDETLGQAIFDAAQGCGLDTRINEPYSAKGDVAHTTRLHAGPTRLRNAMLEIRHDLIADATAQHAMAERLAPILVRALAHQGLALDPATL